MNSKMQSKQVKRRRSRAGFLLSALLAFACLHILAVFPVQIVWAQSSAVELELKIDQEILSTEPHTYPVRQLDHFVDLSNFCFTYSLELKSHTSAVVPEIREFTPALSGRGQQRFARIAFAEPGLYTYVISLDTFSPADKIIPDRSRYTVRIEVTSDTDGQLLARLANPVDADGYKHETISYRHHYDVKTAETTVTTAAQSRNDHGSLPGMGEVAEGFAGCLPWIIPVALILYFIKRGRKDTEEQREEGV